MSEEMQGDKTEPGTGYRRSEARKKGKVARSADVAAAAVLLTGLLALWSAGPAVAEALMQVFRDTLGGLGRPDLDCASARALLVDTMFRAIVPVAPAMVGMAAVGVAASFMQVGFVVTNEAVTPDLNRLDPVSGAQRLFSVRSAAGMGISLLKIAVILAVGWITIQAYVPQLTHLGASTPRGIARTLADAAMDVALRTALLLCAIAVIDYLYQRWQYERDLRMSKQEIKEENRMLEGDPEVQSRVRRAQLALSRSRMMHDVKKADVVVRNPTHFAVALKYDPEQSAAPVVLAKGAGHVAQRIVEMARRHRVPDVHDAPLARALYKSVGVGAAIPPNLYRAVARLLVHIYRLRGRRVPSSAAPRRN
jgi:flagellar biosynthetic protein FlhB